MIGRIWHGWTKPENADGYEQLLKKEILPGIADKKAPGYKGIQLLRRPIDNKEVEFVTIMWFDSWEAVKQFSGEDYERAYVPRRREMCWQGSTSVHSITSSGNGSTTSTSFCFRQ
jgi:heme-degrading monooxygenase HmoA